MPDDKMSKVKSILAGAKPRKARKAKSSSNVVKVSFGSGDGHIVGDNNTITVIKTQKVVHRTQIDPMGGEMSPHQKQRLKDLVNGIVKEAKKGGANTSHQNVWSRFQRRFKINTYHALPQSQYDAAKKYLRMLYGRAKNGSI